MREQKTVEFRGTRKDTFLADIPNINMKKGKWKTFEDHLSLKFRAKREEQECSVRSLSGKRDVGF